MNHKIALLFILAFILVTNCFGQRSSVRFQLGYGVPLSKTSLFNYYYVSGNTASGFYGSYGKGYRLEGAYNYSLNETVSFELDAAYLIGSKMSFPIAGSTTNSIVSASASFGEISPLVKFSFTKSKLAPFIGVGPLIGFGSFVSEFHSNTTVQDQTFKGSVAVGAKTVLGLLLSKGKLSYYAQLSLIYLNYSPSKSEITKDVVNGTDRLSGLSVSQKQFVYTSSYTVATQNPNLPTPQIKFYTPFNSVGVDFGVMYKFGSEVRRK
jgi:hypothetical protein